MEEGSQEMFFCPYCNASISRDSIYCPYCGKRVKPITYPSEIKGFAAFEEAASIFGKNLSLCIPSLLGIIIIFIFAFLLLSALYLTYFESVEEAIRTGLIVGVLLATTGIFIFTFVEGWISAASSNAIQMEDAKLGSSLDLMFRKFLKLIGAVLINILLISPLILWLLLTPVDIILKFGISTYFGILLSLLGALIRTLFMFLVPLLIVTELPFLPSIVKSIKLTVKTTVTDPIFTLSITFYFLLATLIDLVPVIGSLLELFLTLFIYPITVLARVLYLKVNFSVF